MRTIACAFPIASLLIPVCIFAADFSGPVVSVLDGDTLEVLHNNKAERIRLSGIDCPEKGQAFGKRAKQADDSTLLTLATRVKARAFRRYGELLKEIQPQQGGDRGNAATGGRPPIGKTRSSVAGKAGLSPDQRKTALRVANVSSEAFERQVESATPPTMTALAQLAVFSAPS